MTFYYGRDTKGEWRWRLRAGNNETVADSGEGYKTEKGCTDAIDRVKNSASTADVVKKDPLT